jgi:hypothetical protein
MRCVEDKELRGEIIAAFLEEEERRTHYHAQEEHWKQIKREDKKRYRAKHREPRERRERPELIAILTKLQETLEGMKYCPPTVFSDISPKEWESSVQRTLAHLENHYPFFGPKKFYAVNADGTPKMSTLYVRDKGEEKEVHPVDSTAIHHLDGDISNNHPENLIEVKIQEENA